MASLAICAIFKDEAPFISEWVAYHHVVGVGHFFLYDNGSTDGGASALANGPLRDRVTIIPLLDRPGQLRAYRHFIDQFSGDYDWAAFVDVDEFIHPVEGDSITELLPRYDGFSAVLLHWLNFGPGGHLRRPAGLVIESYLQRLPENHEINRHVKTLIRTAALATCSDLGVHVFSIEGAVCNARGQAIPNEPVQGTSCHDIMFINHYYTKSQEDWTTKVRKGRADQPDGVAELQRQDAWFDEYSKNANVVDSRITRFISRIEEVLGIRPDLPEAGKERLMIDFTASGEEKLPETVPATTPGRDAFRSMSLNEIGLLTGTDKASSHHGYLDFYNKLFCELRDRRIILLEIGVDKGQSIAMWTKYFPNAQVVGIDIDPAARSFSGPRVSIEICDANDSSALIDLGRRRGMFDIVVDDGSHIWEHQINAFQSLFPFVRYGGVYVIEDLQTSFAYHDSFEHFRAGRQESTVQYLHRLSQYVVGRHMPVEDEFAQQYLHAMQSITFHYGTAVVARRQLAA